MSMERWNPFRDMDTMRQAMDRWFDDRFPSNWTGSSSGQSMNLPVDLHETENGYELTASMPGVKAEDVDITVNRDTVTIRGRTERSEERTQGNYIYRERHAGTYQRTVRLPEAVNTDEVEAELEHGILRLTLPRLQRTPNRRVQVRSGMLGSQSGLLGNQAGLGQSGATLSGMNQGGTGPGGSQTQQHPGMSQMGSVQTDRGSMSSTGPNVGESGTSAGGTLHGADAMNRSGMSGTSGSGMTGSSSYGSSTSGMTGGSSTTGMTGSSSYGSGSSGSMSGTSGSGMTGSSSYGSGSGSSLSGTSGSGSGSSVSGSPAGSGSSTLGSSTTGSSYGSGSSTGTGMSGSGSTGSSTSSMGSSTSGSSTGMQRPDVLNSASSTQMDEIERHARDNNEQAYRRAAQSYGWDDQTITQVWQYINHRASGDEARRAFGEGNQPGQQPTNSL